MIVRSAKVADAADICDITNPIIRDTTITFTTAERSIASVTDDIRTRGAAFQVVEQAGRVLGFATFGPFRSGPGYAFVREHSIQIDPSAQGRGIGRMLMQHLEAAAIEQKVHVLVAGISGTNAKAIAFHTALGFVEVGRLPQVGYKFGNWLDLILMQKILPQGPDGAPDFGGDAG